MTIDDPDLDPFTSQAAQARRNLAEVMGRVADGDWTAFEKVHRLTSVKLLQICTDLLSDRGDAEDALQETYAGVWTRAASFDPARGSAMTWLITIARNHAIDRLRIRRRTASAPITDAMHISDNQLSALDLLVQQEVQQRLSISLELLDERNRWLVDAVYFKGQSYSHLAAQIGVPIETVKSRVRRALNKARASTETLEDG